MSQWCVPFFAGNSFIAVVINQAGDSSQVHDKQLSDSIGDISQDKSLYIDIKLTSIKVWELYNAFEDNARLESNTLYEINLFKLKK